MQTKTSNLRFVKLFAGISLFAFLFLHNTSVVADTVSTKSCPTDPKTGKLAQCCDGIDNDGDGRVDFYPKGNTPVDPKCLYNEDVEGDTKTQSTIIPCVDKCNVESVFLLINNVIKFFFTDILIPLVVIMLVYVGFGYLTAGGDVGKKVKLVGLLKHIILGIVLILSAWLIVKIILTGLGVDAGLMFLN